MRLLNALPLRRQMMIVTGTLVLFLAGAAVWSANRTRAERESEVSEQASTIASTAAAALDRFFGSLDAMAFVLVRHPAIRALDTAEANRLFAGLMHDQPMVSNVSIRDLNGIVRAAGTGPVDGQAKPLLIPRYVSRVLETGQPALGDFEIGPLAGKPTVVQAYPVFADSGALVGVITFGIDLLRVQKVFENIPLPNGSVITLVDRQSRVIARSVDGELFVGSAFAPQPIEPKDSPRTFAKVGADGVERFHANAVVNRGPWLLSVAISRAVVVGRLAPLWRRNLAIVLSSVLAVFVLALWLSHSWSVGLNRLRALAQRIADGDLSPPERLAMPNLEIAELQDGFITMAAKLSETRTALDRQVEQERSMRETLQSLQRQLVRQERLAAVGLLVSGVAHELNNPLQAILGTAELVERHPGIPADVLDEISLLKTQSSRAREIIRNLSRFGSQQSGLPALVDLRSVIAEVIQLRRHTLEEAGITLDVEATASGNVFANITELEQVTLNFVINAQQAIQAAAKGNGRIVIRLYDEGEKVRLEVHDNGLGVSPEDERKLFQPFFTTKPVGQGTGLGLSVSYGIIESYGGTIGYRGNEWRGATFFFELPAADFPAGESLATDRVFAAGRA